MRWVVVVCALAGCSRVTTTPGADNGQSTITVMVSKRIAVHDVASLVFTVTNGSSTTSETVRVSDASFPLNYELDVPGTMGSLDIKVGASDENGSSVGRGTTTYELGGESAAVNLQGVDFQLNSVAAGNQFLTDDFETVGLQLASTFFDSWMVAFREDCTSCSMFGRRFDSAGRALLDNTSNSIGQFPLNTTATTSASIPTLAAGFNGIVALWDFTATTGTAQGIGCRPMNLGGTSFAEAMITTEPADVVTATSTDLSDRIILTWQSFTTTQVVRTMMVTSGCAPMTSPVTLSQTSGTTGARRSHVAAAGTAVVYTWIVDGEVHARFGTDDGTLNPAETTLLAKTATDEIAFVRVVRLGQTNVFALAVRRVASSGAGAGRIELYLLTPTGAMSSPLVVTDQSGSDFASAKAFGLASRSDGTVMVVWHACPTGPGSCDVFGRYVSSELVAIGDVFVVPTKSTFDQVNPSVAALGDSFIIAWTDSSMQLPDTSGTAVRARILVPEL